VAAIVGVLGDVAADLCDDDLEEHAVGVGDVAVVGPHLLEQGVHSFEGRRLGGRGEAVLVPAALVIRH
jgi:hypothetical protein